MLTAAVDTPSPRASSLWLRYTSSSSIRRHSQARHPTGFRSLLSQIPWFKRRMRTSANEVRQVLATRAPGAPLPRRQADFVFATVHPRWTRTASSTGTCLIATDTPNRSKGRAAHRPLRDGQGNRMVSLRWTVIAGLRRALPSTSWGTRLMEALPEELAGRMPRGARAARRPRGQVRRGSGWPGAGPVHIAAAVGRRGSAGRSPT